jgi:hypothetical protein
MAGDGHEALLDETIDGRESSQKPQRISAIFCILGTIVDQSIRVSSGGMDAAL